MNPNNILTIAIPAYNRVETLEQIIKQLKSQSDQNFELIISDDASPDNGGIKQMVGRYIKDMPQLHYYRNEINLGFSGNICKLYELANTRYVWFLCDDDSVFEDSVKNINDSLKKYEPVVAVYNHTWINPYGVKLLAGPKHDIIYDNLSKLDDYQPIMRTTFLSSLVVEKRLPIDVIKSTNYKDNVFVQITISLLLLSNKFKFCEIALPILHRNVGYKYGDFYKFYLVDEFKSIYAIKHNFDNEKFIQWKKRQLFTALLLYLSQKIGLFSYKLDPTKETMDKIANYYGMYKYFIYSFKYVKLLTPTVLLKTIYLIQLMLIHGVSKGLKVYKQNINRAFTDARKTGFVSYK